MSLERFIIVSILTLVTLSLHGVRTNTFEVVRTTPKPGGDSKNNTVLVENIHFHFWSFGDTLPLKNTNATKVPSSCVCEENLGWYVIRNPASGLVVHLDDFNNTVIQNFNGHPRQLWKFVPTNIPGVYNVVNKQSGTFLDVVNMNNHNVVANQKNDGRLNQQWIWNYDGRLYNVGMDKVLDIPRGDYHSGNRLIVFSNKWGPNQKYVLEKH